MRTKLSHWVGASLSHGDLLFVGAHQINVLALVQAKQVEPNRIDRVVQHHIVP